MEDLATTLETTFDCVGLGIIAYDHLLTMPTFPQSNSKNKVRSYAQQGGGPVPTALSVLGAWGKQTALITKVGNDAAAQALEHELAQFHVDTSGWVRSDSISTPQSFVIIDARNGDRTVLLSRPPETDLTPDELPLELIKNCKILHLDAHEAASLEAAKVAKTQNVLVSVDIGSDRPLPHGLFEYVDIAIVSESFARAQLEKNPLKSCEKLLHFGAKFAAVTCGHRGSYCANSWEQFYQPAFQVKVVDTTGAGDVFHGAALFAILGNYSLQQTAMFASAAAALACTKVGGKAGIPTLVDIQKLMQKENYFL